MAAKSGDRRAQLARAAKKVQVRARLIGLRQKKTEIETRIRAAREELKST